MSEAAQQMSVGVLAVAVGVSGWLLPQQWNPLRLRASYARLVPETVNAALPKILGTFLAVLGAGLILHAAGLI